MINIEQAVPNFKECFEDYTPVVDSIGTVLLKATSPENKHNEWVLLQKEDQYGYLYYGWREDLCEIPIAKCKNYRELDEFRITLNDNVRWGTKAELAEFFNINDWTCDFSWQYSEFQTFIAEAKKLLSE